MSYDFRRIDVIQEMDFVVFAHRLGDSGTMSDPKMQAAAIVLAAGKSTRMKSEKPKVLHDLCGLPLLGYVLQAVDQAGIRRKVVVVGFGAAEVKASCSAETDVEFAIQDQQRGTGHAVMVCKEALKSHDGPVVVLAGDAPFVRPEMLAQLLERFHQSQASAFVATAFVKNPFGYGRIVRDAKGEFDRIVEQKDATPAEAAIQEINPSFYVFDGKLLFEALDSVRPENAQGEYYLTDVPGILKRNGKKVVAEALADEVDMYGINHRRHLGEAHALMQDRIQGKLMDQGVTIVDPRSTSIDARAVIGKETIIRPFSVIGGPVKIGANCKIGPFAHIRENVELADGVELGAFVEIVRSSIGEGTCARHLTYIGDSTFGKNVTVGAGAITANFNGQTKNQTKVGDDALLGAGSIYIAPVNVGNDAIVGAGSVVTSNHHVEAGSKVMGVPARKK